jgi:ketosteroid isomerase-like protein
VFECRRLYGTILSKGEYARARKPDVSCSLIKHFIAAYNAFDIDGMMAVIHPDIEFKNVSGGEVNATTSGAGDFRLLAEKSSELFRSRKQKILTLWSNADQASIAEAFEGVLASDLPNGMKAGETLRLNGRSEFTFCNGKIYRI